MKKEQRTFILIARNPKTKRLVVVDDGDYPVEYESEESAIEATRHRPICRVWGAQVVPVEM